MVITSSTSSPLNNNNNRFSSNEFIYSSTSSESLNSMTLSRNSISTSTSTTSVGKQLNQVQKELKIGCPIKLNITPNPRSQRPPEISQWKFAQCFGDKSDTLEVAEADIISTVQFDKTGNFLASGDHAGRLVLFQRNERKKGCEYKFWSEFQSHEPEFDYLKSLEINEKINKIVFCPSFSEKYLHLLTCNDKTIKLWKVGERKENGGGGGGIVDENSGVSGVETQKERKNPNLLLLPKIKRKNQGKQEISSTPRHIYSNAHIYHIHSISVSADDQSFLSADDLRINLWHLERPKQSWTIIDLKPDAIEDLTEVLTVTQFHPSEPQLFGYATSKGNVKLCDMRLSSDFKQSSISSISSTPSSPSSRSHRQSFFSELITSISDLKFSPCGRKMVTRDYLTLKIWDISFLSRGPVQQIPIHDSIKSSLCDLYENDQIFDKFECEWTSDALSILTGSYGNLVRVCNLNGKISNEIDSRTISFRSKNVIGTQFPIGGGDDLIHADKSLFRNPGAINASLSAIHQSSSTITSKRAFNGGTQTLLSSMLNSMDQTGEQSTLDWDRKIMHLSHHPKEPTVAIASLCNLFIFSQI